jgi:hypothetical protein
LLFEALIVEVPEKQKRVQQTFASHFCFELNQGRIQGGDGGARPLKTGLGGFLRPDFISRQMSVLPFYIEYVRRFLQLDPHQSM